MIELTLESLSKLKRAEIQTLCKKNSLKGNGTTAALIESLVNLLKVNNQFLVVEPEPIPFMKAQDREESVVGAEEKFELLVARMGIFDQVVLRLENQLTTLHSQQEGLRKEMELMETRLVEGNGKGMERMKESLNKLSKEIEAVVIPVAEVVRPVNAPMAPVGLAHLSPVRNPILTSPSLSSDAPPINSLASFSSPVASQEVEAIIPKSPTRVFAAPSINPKSSRKVSSNLSNEIFVSPLANTPSESTTSTKRPRPEGFQETKEIIPSVLSPSATTTASGSFYANENRPVTQALVFTASKKSLPIKSLPFPLVSTGSTFYSPSTTTTRSRNPIAFSFTTTTIESPISTSTSASSSSSSHHTKQSSTTTTTSLSFQPINPIPIPTPEGNKTLFGTEKNERFGDYFDSPLTTGTGSNLGSGRRGRMSPSKIIRGLGGWGGFGER